MRCHPILIPIFWVQALDTWAENFAVNASNTIPLFDPTSQQTSLGPCQLWSKRCLGRHTSTCTEALPAPSSLLLLFFPPRLCASHHCNRCLPHVAPTGASHNAKARQHSTASGTVAGTWGPPTHLAQGLLPLLVHDPHVRRNRSGVRCNGDAAIKHNIPLLVELKAWSSILKGGHYNSVKYRRNAFLGKQRDSFTMVLKKRIFMTGESATHRPF